MSELTDLLLQGPRSAPELRQRLAISQATFSRLVARENRVIRFGKARATRYVLLRPYRGIERIPVWRVDDAGKAHKFADIRLCWPQGSCLVTGADGDEQWFDGLPWYLTDLRPQGFLGRAWGRKLAAQLNLTDDIRLWQEEDVLYALTVFNGEYTGGWLVGRGIISDGLLHNALRKFLWIKNSPVTNSWQAMLWLEKLWVLLRAASSQNLPAMHKRRQAINMCW